MQYGIWCISRGPTLGRQEAWLKKNGEVQLFATMEEAQKKVEVIQSHQSPMSSYNQQYFAQEYI